jgi:hypothetical protein
MGHVALVMEDMERQKTAEVGMAVVKPEYRGRVVWKILQPS